MAIDNDEVDDVAITSSEDWDDQYDDCYPEIVTVRFCLEGGKSRGRVTSDVRGKSRTKIVFPDKSWLGPLPKHGEELRVLVTHETEDRNPQRGVLFVERILPVITKGGQCGTCTACRGLVPLYDSRPIAGTSMVKTNVRDLSTCNACGALYRIRL